MNTITTKDGTIIYFKDWGPKNGPVITFSHGWPLSSDAWEAQMFFLASNGFRCIAHDRRGHGRSSQPWDGNHMDQYADDLAELFEKLDMGEQLVLHVLVQYAVFGDELIMQVNFPLHISSMHYNNYAVKCIPFWSK